MDSDLRDTLNSNILDIQNCQKTNREELIKSFDQQLDKYFDITYESTEKKKLGFDKDLYEDITLDIQAFNTSYFDFLTILDYLKENNIKSFCELGCGYFRSGHLAKYLYKTVNVIGVELSKHRQDFLAFRDLQVFNSDLKTGVIPNAQAYFVYLPEGVIIENIISKLPLEALIFVIESHGGLLSQFNNDERVQKIKKLELLSKRHFDGIHLFKKINNDINSRNALIQNSLLYDSYYLVDLNAMKFIACSQNADFYYHKDSLHIEFKKPNWLIKDINHVNLIKRDLTSEEKRFLHKEYDGETKRIYVDPKLILDNGIERCELEKDCFDFFGGLEV
jgi:SAM-dependent methyltransferase